MSIAEFEQDELAGQPLMISRLVIVGKVLGDRGTQMALAEKASLLRHS
jgi:hypothetical protein